MLTTLITAAIDHAHRAICATTAINRAHRAICATTLTAAIDRARRAIARPFAPHSAIATGADEPLRATATTRRTTSSRPRSRPRRPQRRAGSPPPPPARCLTPRRAAGTRYDCTHCHPAPRLSEPVHGGPACRPASCARRVRDEP